MDNQVHNTEGPAFLPARIGNGPITITSREIAELTGKRHDQVLRTARDLVEQGVTQSVETTYRHDQNGQDYPEHLLTKRDSLVLVARLSPEFTARVVDRWQELEAGQGLRLPTTAEAFASAFTMLAEQERKQAALEAEQTAQASRIATTERRLDQIETATDHFTCIGYARWAKQTSIDLKEAADLGRRASKRCRELGIPVSKIPDPRFGAVNQFPKAILDEAWDEKFGPAS